MYRGLSVIAIVPVFNEEAKIGNVIGRVPTQVVDEVLVVDNGSTDGSGEPPLPRMGRAVRSLHARHCSSGAIRARSSGKSGFAVRRRASLRAPSS